MTESDYWQKFRKHLVPRVYAWKIQASYIGGIPDWWGSGSHQDLWVENKRIARDVDPPAILDLTDHKNYLSVLQQQWLEHRHNEGRNTGVVVFSRAGHIFLAGLDWKKPISKLDFYERAMPYSDLATKLINILGELPLEARVG
jgi:hypothetical protein